MKNTKNTFQPFNFLLSGSRITMWVWVLALAVFIQVVSCRSQKGGSGSAKHKTSWLSRLFRKEKDPSKSAGFNKREVDKVIQTARSYRGTPHRDGGVSRLGIDCSALIMLSFQGAGIKIPRTARQQSEIGKSINKEELRPGDLVFFSDRKIGSGITHVGLVTEITTKGEIRFIHTSSRLGVTENLLSTSYFTKTYAKAVRPF